MPSQPQLRPEGRPTVQSNKFQIYRVAVVFHSMRRDIEAQESV